MGNRLAEAVSPYLRSHADNPVDWHPWGDEAFAEARARDVPVLVSIGYSTCHWCHVMARESFSDPALAERLNPRFVAVKVDREEHPEVDSAYMAAAGAFTRGLGWPLNVFATPEGRPFFAVTYCPPEPVQGHPSFRDVLDAVETAWTERREEIERVAGAVAGAVSQPVVDLGTAVAEPNPIEFGRIIAALAEAEDAEFGGFGSAPKFPVAPVLLMLQRLAELDLLTDSERAEAGQLAERSLDRMSASPLRDPVEGGFFRYGTRRDWSDPHYERMLYDNALLLRAYSVQGERETAEGIVRFLRDVLRQESGGFGSAQDSESIVAGERSEGGYYALDASARAAETPPRVDGKVLTGWNGLAIGALSVAGVRFEEPEWIALARAAADFLLENHLDGGRLLRASLAGRRSSATAALEDYGMLARGLLDLSIAAGEPRYADAARQLVDAVDMDGTVRTPGGGEPVLARQGLLPPIDPSEGAYPSGLSQLASAALTLFELTGERRYRSLAERAVEPLASLAAGQPISMGGALTVLAELRAPAKTLIVIAAQRSSPLAKVALGATGLALVAVIAPEEARAFAAANFGVFEGRAPKDGRDVAYLCEGLVCRMPARTPEQLEAALLQDGGAGITFAL